MIDRAVPHSSSIASPVAALVGGYAVPGAIPFPSDDLMEVLLVEDDEADAYLIEQALAQIRSIGRIVVARDGIEALSLVDEGTVHPDFALIDLQMPRMDGLRLLVELNARSVVDFPLFVLTSSAAPIDVQRARRRHARKYCLKKSSVYEMKRSLLRVLATLP